ncbi:DNA photolyase [Leptospira ellisii]|uniref:DNA photolyase n=1 Tax=Leptospira ellisii TaxID=2023197 RepID=A0A2N0BLA2_9LEPT|nr:DNA photolyase [Leptospira ellisii]MDV6234174.1 DNA photolyase [Leptospira ellisii]PJZ92173.1 DNA photolyase [Leptospira ellisii]PKA04792.1 DNA photolyase [Leptospira ellisii]
MRSENFISPKRFSHIYVERSAENHPKTSEILSKFPESSVVSIDSYKEVFNPSAQNFQAQKRSPKLILAERKDQFLYSGSGIAPDFGYRHFYYNALVLNCLYNCSYCYLQGMYSSANVVVFVNNGDYFRETDERLKLSKPLYLCISYDTDLLALESILGYCKEWIEFARSRPDLIVELRTKSANFKSIASLKPAPNVILAWTLSPESVIKEHEPLTPRLASRLKNVKQALEAGWQVRLCLDPILNVPDWKTIYREFVGDVFREIPGDKLREISLGVFRMNSEYFKNSKKRRSNSYLYYLPMETRSSVKSYPEELEKEMFSVVEKELESFVPKEKIHRLIANETV